MLIPTLELTVVAVLGNYVALLDLICTACVEQRIPQGARPANRSIMFVVNIMSHGWRVEHEPKFLS